MDPKKTDTPRAPIVSLVAFDRWLSSPDLPAEVREAGQVVRRYLFVAQQLGDQRSPEHKEAATAAVDHLQSVMKHAD